MMKRVFAVWTILFAIFYGNARAASYPVYQAVPVSGPACMVDFGGRMVNANMVESVDLGDHLFNELVKRPEWYKQDWYEYVPHPSIRLRMANRTEYDIRSGDLQKQYVEFLEKLSKCK